MLSKVYSAGAFGIDAVLVEIEVDLRGGLPGIVVVGLPDAAIKESRDRVRSAISNSGYEFPRRRSTVNLAPADLKKEGPVYDLPIALAILAASEQIPAAALDDTVILGELALDGRVRPVRGVLPAVLAAAQTGKKRVLVPAGNAAEGGVVEDIAVYGVESLAETVGVVTGELDKSPVQVDLEDYFRDHETAGIDFADVRGQEHVKRALTVAASGSHNVLMIGPPGSGKSMMAKRIPTILPRLTLAEALETTKIHSVAGVLEPNTPLVATRPFRAPHTTISYAGLVGGGAVPAPGEISLAHNGVLFLDEIPELDRKCKEALRQPLEDGGLTVSRAAASVTFPARVMFIAAMNPCPCGYYSDERRACRCSSKQITDYFGRISGPLLDRIDLHIEVPAVNYEELSSDRAGEASAAIQQRVQAARKVQHQRLAGSGAHTNSGMAEKQVKQYCKVTGEAEQLVRHAMTELGFSARAYGRILKVARTIADLDSQDDIQAHHISEAIGYRALDRSTLPA